MYVRSGENRSHGSVLGSKLRRQTGDHLRHPRLRQDRPDRPLPRCRRRDPDRRRRGARRLDGPRRRTQDGRDLSGRDSEGRHRVLERAGRLRDGAPSRPVREESLRRSPTLHRRQLEAVGHARPDPESRLISTRGAGPRVREEDPHVRRRSAPRCSTSCSHRRSNWRCRRGSARAMPGSARVAGAGSVSPRVGRAAPAPRRRGRCRPVC